MSENTSDNNSDDQNEKTSIMTGDTHSGIRRAEQTPPVMRIIMGPPGYVNKQWALTSSSYVIGRSPECDVFVDDRSVSRTHAKLMVVGHEVTIQDLGSSNSTAINGTVLIPMTPKKLLNNDQAKCGNVIFRFLERGALEAAADMQLAEKAERDGLTGIYNKGSLLERGPESVKRAEVLSEPLSILVFDIDFFKKINDGFGHPGGDYVLKHMCRVISSKLIRSNDYFARYGGEEFVLILPSAPTKNATEIAERVRATVEGTVFTFEGRQIPVNISVGTATLKPGEDWDGIFNRADAALYQSKKGGRNRVTVAE
jgi:diguanylate cyclase (GGDEF)-like protein